MEEKKDEKTEEPKDDNKEVIGAAKGIVDEANEAASRLERANKKAEELIGREEALRVKGSLGGKAEASGEKQEETPEEYAKKVMANEVGTD